MVRVAVSGELFTWALGRARRSIQDLGTRFPKLTKWVAGEDQPTLRQLEDFAKATYAPLGYFFLAEPPVESVPIPDFRTIGGDYIQCPSPDLLDTIYICQQRQDWYREYARVSGERPFPFVGRATTASDIVEVAADMRRALAFDLDERRRMGTWVEALQTFIGQADNLGILVMVNGVVGSNNRRKLDPQEFRGFALTDPVAPLVFVNGADTKAAQMFTLAHELAHLWLGESGLTDVEPRSAPTDLVERWCNLVAAELLAPLAIVRREYDRRAPLPQEMKRLASRFKISTLVVLRRIHDAGGLAGDRYHEAYDEEVERLLSLPRGAGGSFYRTTAARVSERFARAVVTSTWEGRSSFTEAFRLLGFKNMRTFRELGHRVGVAI
ncbi:MAG: ImmA/IrrE family metallo-endopeptidase [Planctomycetes bacterium]|nr:ImmA/IrrE family metallo-endopeptidase [Planctomycetota bacterium]